MNRSSVQHVCFILNREDDVAAVDVNMGCPKEYSTKVQIWFCVEHTVGFGRDHLKKYLYLNLGHIHQQHSGNALQRHPSIHVKLTFNFSLRLICNKKN